MKNLYCLHRWVGIVFFVFFLISALTGLFCAYAPYIYLKKGYMKIKKPIPSPQVSEVVLTPQQAIQLAQTQAGNKTNIVSITLRPNFGELVYEVQYRQSNGERAILVDARKGEVISPISEALAEKIARQYIDGNPPPGSVTLLEKYRHWNGRIFHNVYRIRFDQKKQTEFFVDSNSGNVIDEQDTTRKFHFFIARLHQLSFFGFKKTLTAIPGISLIAIAVSGLLMWIIPRRKMYK